MKLYKVGLSENVEPLLNNSALYEYNMLKAILEPIDCSDHVCILNGIGDPTEVLNINKRKIFIATDGFCFTQNKEVIDNCDFIIHQSEKHLDFITKPQTYNYVPFLFINNKPKSYIQDSKVIFGGANRGRDDKINKYILNGTEYNPGVVAFLKMYDQKGNVLFDNRVNYEEFIKILRSYKYTICFSRKEYDEMQWTTARFFESISNYVLPFVDNTYCVYHEFNADIVTSYEELWNNILSMSEDERMEKLNGLRFIMNKYKNAFKDTIIDIIS